MLRARPARFTPLSPPQANTYLKTQLAFNARGRSLLEMWSVSCLVVRATSRRPLQESPSGVVHAIPRGFRGVVLGGSSPGVFQQNRRVLAGTRLLGASIPRGNALYLRFVAVLRFSLSRGGLDCGVRAYRAPAGAPFLGGRQQAVLCVRALVLVEG